MKKILLSLICIAILATSMLAFVGCASQTDTEVATSLFTEQGMKDELTAFVTANPDRTSQTKKAAGLAADGEELAAQWLETRLGEIFADVDSRNYDVDSNAFTTTTLYGDEFGSSNVIGQLRADSDKNPNGYRVVISASYDNEYSTVSLASGSYTGNYFTGTSAEGAMANGTGVATVLSLAKYFATESVRERLTVDIDFAFFGMGCIDYSGATRYLSNLGNQAQNKLLLAINVDSLGGDSLIAYFDEVSTTHGEFIMGAAEDAGLSGAIVQPSAFRTDLAYQVTESLPYTPTSLLSDAATFFGAYNVFALTSGSTNEFFVYDRESDGSDNIAYTGADTLANLERTRPAYAKQMAIAAETISTALIKDGFTEAMVKSRESIGSYAWLNYPMAGYITVAALSAIAIVVIVIIVRSFEKKHKDDPEIKRNVKVAVFGMDYEKPEENEIFVDIHSADPFDNAFDDEEDK